MALRNNLPLAVGLPFLLWMSYVVLVGKLQLRDEPTLPRERPYWAVETAATAVAPTGVVALDSHEQCDDGQLFEIFSGPRTLAPSFGLCRGTQPGFLWGGRGYWFDPLSPSDAAYSVSVAVLRRDIVSKLVVTDTQASPGDEIWSGESLCPAASIDGQTRVFTVGRSVAPITFPVLPWRTYAIVPCLDRPDGTSIVVGKDWVRMFVHAKAALADFRLSAGIRLLTLISAAAFLAVCLGVHLKRAVPLARTSVSEGLGILALCAFGAATGLLTIAFLTVFPPDFGGPNVSAYEDDLELSKLSLRLFSGMLFGAIAAPTLILLRRQASLGGSTVRTVVALVAIAFAYQFLTRQNSGGVPSALRDAKHGWYIYEFLQFSFAFVLLAHQPIGGHAPSTADTTTSQYARLVAVTIGTLLATWMAGIMALDMSTPGNGVERLVDTGWRFYHPWGAFGRVVLLFPAVAMLSWLSIRHGPASIGSLDIPLQAARKKWDVFISYSSTDYAFADWLSCELTRRGVRCFLDRQRMKVGAVLDVVMFDEIQRSSRTIFILSKQSLRSPWVRYEASVAFEMERDRVRKGESGQIIVPIELDESIRSERDWSLGPLLRERLAADFRGWPKDSATNYVAEVDRLAETFCKRDAT